MYLVKREANKLEPLETETFSKLKIRERDHLQEWIADTPEVLGEDLLIIQKEFDGFEGTRRRLDLLALDKGGDLVVIENKLDDSGKDVTWQALQYAAFVSGMTKAQIVDVYQSYLDRHEHGQDAAERICEFLEIGDIEEAVLNPGNAQRLIMVAGEFPKEVTATALWLIGRGIRAQCFKATPFSLGEDTFLDIRQIIPPREAEEFMVVVSQKENEEIAARDAQRSHGRARLEFWTAALDRLEADGIDLYRNISPTADSWLGTASGTPGCRYHMIFNRSEVRVELWLAKPQPEANKRLFDALSQQKSQIETAFGAKLDWLRLEGKKSCRIAHAHPFDGTDRENWPGMAAWLSEHIRKFEAAFRGHLAEADAAISGTRGNPRGKS